VANSTWINLAVSQQQANPILLPDGTAAAPSLTFGTQTNLGLYKQGTNQIGISIAGTEGFEFNNSGFQLLNSNPVIWTLGTKLTEDAANTLAQRNGTNPQIFNLYGTFTDASNYERVQLGVGIVGAVADFSLVTSKAGTGQGRDFFIGNRGAGVLYFRTNDANRWLIDGSVGHFLAGTDNTYDIGASGATRPRNLYLGSKILNYNAITTAGQGMPAIYSEAITATQTANFTVLTYTPPATAGRYRVSGVITTTSATNTGTVQMTVDYKDSQGTTHTADVMALMDAAGSIATTKTGASKEYHALDWKFSIDNSATNIVVKVVITGAVSYTASASVEQIG
jgi:hypothetical protein